MPFHTAYAAGPLSGRLARHLPWLVLALGLASTLWYWQTLAAQVAAEGEKDFATRVNRIEDALNNRLQAYRLALQGAAALFSASREVSRAEWSAYVEALDLQRNYPGIQGMGYAKSVRTGEETAIIATARAEGFSDFTIWPADKRETVTTILYLEPMDHRNRRALGFDMHSESTRREAMARARDTGRPSLSGRVTLVQETDRDVQSGFLIYQPVYRKGMPLDTPAGRRAALLGWVYAPFRMGDFMAGLLGQNPMRDQEIDLEVFDGANIASANLMWDFDDTKRWRYEPAGGLSAHRTLAFDGHVWTLHFATRPAFHQSANTWKPTLVLIAGLAVSLLAFALMRALASTRTRALNLASEMTSALATSEERHRLMFMTNQAVKLLIDPAGGKIVDANPAAETYYGYSRDELLKLAVTDINILSRDEIAAEMKLAVAEKRLHFNFRHRLANGEIRDVEVYTGPVPQNGTTLLYSIVHDVTERNRIQAQQRAILATALVGLAHLRDRRLLWTNAGLNRMFGYQPGELDGTETAQLYAEQEEYERIGHEAYPTLLKGENYETRARMRRKDGSTFWCMLSGSIIDTEQPDQGTIWALKDIDAFVAAQEALSTLNAKLLDLSRHDPLTGLYNRRHLDEALEHEIRLARRKGREMAAIMLDIDLFKRINDQFGHDTGDEVLRAVAGLLAAHVRATDIACRHGGEEFLLVLPETGLEAALLRAEALRSACEALCLQRDGHDLGRITLSLGVAVYPTHASDSQTLVAAADAALYRAKQGGRNRVEPAAPGR